MTQAEHGNLFEALKRARGQCLDVADALDRWLAEHPSANRGEARLVALTTLRAPWPSIRGNPPVYRDRPFYDARFWEGERAPDD